MAKELSIDEFLEKKRDFSPFLVHLTKDDEEFCAKDVLDMILDENTLRAYNHFFLYSPNLKLQNASLIEKFKVVCFTETPIDQIDILLNRVSGRNFKPDPYGLVFKKEYIREKGEGNPVFYVTKKIVKPLWDSLYEPHVEGKKQTSEKVEKICKLLALVTVCKKGNDWHWEREWRIVGNLVFNLSDIYCGLCPEGDIPYFENKYSLNFISPYWGINKILDKLVNLSKEKTLTADDIPF